MSVTVASAPPVTIASVSPLTINRYAVEIASLELAQALDAAKLGPCRPCHIEIWADAALLISIGMKNGLTRLAVPSARALLT